MHRDELVKLSVGGLRVWHFGLMSHLLGELDASFSDRVESSPARSVRMTALSV